MKRATLTGKHGERSSPVTPHSDTTISQVESVGRGKVKVTLVTGATLICMDDGSFVAWLGGSDSE
jgi:hypothetical protein